MLKRLSILICAAFCGVFLCSGCASAAPEEKTHLPDVKLAKSELPEKPEIYIVTVPIQCIEPAPEPEPEPERASPQMSEGDVALIALMTMAEAESESEQGKRLVIDAILNRVDSEHYPNTVYDVLYQPYQFSPVWNGRLKRCEVREDICELVREELESRTNSEVIFFREGRYSAYGTPLFQVGNHYFSSYI